MYTTDLCVTLFTSFSLLLSVCECVSLFMICKFTMTLRCCCCGVSHFCPITIHANHQLLRLCFFLLSVKFKYSSHLNRNHMCTSTFASSHSHQQTKNTQKLKQRKRKKNKVRFESKWLLLFLVSVSFLFKSIFLLLLLLYISNAISSAHPFQSMCSHRLSAIFFFVFFSKF